MRLVLEPLPTATLAFVVVCWIVFFASFVRNARPSGGEARLERKSDPASRIGIGIQGVAFATVWAAHRPYFTPFISAGAGVEVVLSILTAALAVLSVWFAAAAARELGKEWSLTARVVEGHRLVTGGPYRPVRHPIYTAMLGMLLATALAAGHWLPLPFALFVFVLGTLMRVRSEERLLRETFGARYEGYARRVKAFIPGVL